MVPKIRPMEMPPSRAQVAGSGSRRLSPASAQFSYFGRKRIDSPRGDGPAIPKGSRVRWSRHSAGCRRSSPGGGGHVVHLLGLDLAANKLWPARKRLGANSSRAANRPRLLAVVIDSGCSLLCAGQPAATQSLVRPLPRSNGIYCIGPAIPGRARTSLMRVPAKASPTSAGPPPWPHRLWRRRHPALAWIRNCPRRRSLRCRS